MLKKRKCDKVKSIRPAPPRAEEAAYAIKSFLVQCVRLIFRRRASSLKIVIPQKNGTHNLSDEVDLI